MAAILSWPQCVNEQRKFEETCPIFSQHCVYWRTDTAKSCGICRYSGDLIRDLYLNLPLDKMAAISQTILSYCIFVNKKSYIVIQIWLKFVSKGPIDNNPTQV